MDQCIYGSCKSLVVTVKLPEMRYVCVCDYTNILFLFLSAVACSLKWLQQSLSSFLRSFGCLRALQQIAYAAHAAPQTVVSFAAACYDTKSVPTGGLSEDLVANANARQLPR